MSSEKTNNPPSYDDDSKIYHLALERYEGWYRNDDGRAIFTDLISAYNDVIALSPRSTWAEVERMRWRKIVDSYPAIASECNSRAFVQGFSLEYTRCGSQKIEKISSSTVPDDMFFGMLERSDIVVVKVYTRFAPRFPEIPELYGGYGTLGWSTTNEDEKRAQEKKKRNRTHGCIMQ